MLVKVSSLVSKSVFRGNQPGELTIAAALEELYDQRPLSEAPSAVPSATGSNPATEAMLMTLPGSKLKHSYMDTVIKEAIRQSSRLSNRNGTLAEKESYLGCWHLSIRAE